MTGSDDLIAELAEVACNAEQQHSDMGLMDPPYVHIVAAVLEHLVIQTDVILLKPIKASKVYNGEKYVTLQHHRVEGYSALEQVSPGGKTSGNPMLGPDVTVFKPLEI